MQQRAFELQSNYEQNFYLFLQQANSFDAFTVTVSLKNRAVQHTTLFNPLVLSCAQSLFIQYQFFTTKLAFIFPDQLS